jgi:hypothetical protein
VERERVRTLDITGAVMVCISYLQISGQPVHLRYLIRRLRIRLPGAPVLVGLWPAEALVLADKSLQATFGANHYNSSLHDAVTACVAEADARREAASKVELGSPVGVDHA